MRIRILVSRCYANIAVDKLNFEKWNAECQNKSNNLNKTHGTLLWMLEYMESRFHELNTIHLSIIKETTLHVLKNVSNYTVRIVCIQILSNLESDPNVAQEIVDMIISKKSILMMDNALLHFTRDALSFVVDYTEIVLVNMEDLMNHPVLEIKSIFIRSLSNLKSNRATSQVFGILRKSILVKEIREDIISTLAVLIKNSVALQDCDQVEGITSMLCNVLKTTGDVELQASSVICLGHFSGNQNEWMNLVIQFTSEKSATVLKEAILISIEKNVDNLNNIALSILDILIVDQEEHIRNHASRIISKICKTV